ncbi:hypothetical protein HAX54_023894 [Datura stramonium]|uniref:Uncharacterized protein n=1 Tax=Datura stramonium TaxID=4076 RepID=A0ABS8S4Z2_DATST|nr:hypothetical protein [Datura stramonium]
MAALSLRLPQIPLTNLRFSRTRRPLKILRCFSTSPSATSEPYTTVEYLSPASQSIPSVLESNKWEPFIKKKVVMRVGYVGSDYRGLQMQRDEHELSSPQSPRGPCHSQDVGLTQHYHIVSGNQ